MSTTSQVQVNNNPIRIFPNNERQILEYAEPIHSKTGISYFEIATVVPVTSDQEIVNARREGRILAERMGFLPSEATLIATTISELARNIVHYAESGEILLGTINGGDRPGIVVIAQDRGPGISDILLAVRDGYSTSGGLGLGLPGIKRIMDEFEIVSRVGNGTTVRTVKWK